VADDLDLLDDGRLLLRRRLGRILGGHGDDATEAQRTQSNDQRTATGTEHVHAHGHVSIPVRFHPSSVTSVSLWRRWRAHADSAPPRSSCQYQRAASLTPTSMGSDGRICPRMNASERASSMWRWMARRSGRAP